MKRRTKRKKRPRRRSRVAADDADVCAAAKTWKVSVAMKALREPYGPVEHGGRPWDITRKRLKAALDKENPRSNLDGDDLFGGRAEVLMLPMLAR
jgi:hypothetical protein